MSDQNTPNNSVKSDLQGGQTKDASTQDALGVPSQGSGNQSTTNDLGALLKKLENLEKDNFTLRDRERQRKEAEEQERNKFLEEQGKYKEALDEYKKRTSTTTTELEDYRSKVEKYETTVKNLTESQFKELTSEQQKQFVQLFGTDLDPATKLEKINAFLKIIPQNTIPKPGSPAKQGINDALNQLLVEAKKNPEIRREATQDFNMIEIIKQKMSSK